MITLYYTVNVLHDRKGPSGVLCWIHRAALVTCRVVGGEQIGSIWVTSSVGPSWIHDGKTLARLREDATIDEKKAARLDESTQRFLNSIHLGR